MPPIAVHEVATFYNMYETAPAGRFKLSVCTCLPCALRDGNTAGEYLKDKLGIDYNETTADGLFTLKESECLGACGDAPVLLVNNKRMCSFMSADKLDAPDRRTAREGRHRERTSTCARGSPTFARRRPVSTAAISSRRSSPGSIRPRAGS